MAVTKVYKGLNGNWIVGDETVPVGKYRLNPNNDESKAEIKGFDNEYELTKMQLIGNYTDKEGVPYATYADMKKALKGLIGIDGFTPEFLLNVGMGRVDGVSYIRKFSYVPNLQSTTGERDIWEYGSTTWGDVDYDFPEDGTAPIDTLSSSSALDDGDIVVQGLDIDGNEVIQIITINGQNKVVLNTPLWRVYRMVNVTPSNKTQRNVGFNGEIYVYEDTAIVTGVPTDKTKVRAFVNDGNNSTLMSMYTCPAGKTGFFLNIEPRIVKKGNASVLINGYVRDYGTVTRKVDVGALSATGTSTFAVRNDIPIKFSEKSDILLTADVDTNGTGLALIMYIILFDNDKWSFEP